MVRLYEPEKDYDYIYQALKAEGLKRIEMTFELDNTFIVDNGFFSYTTDGEYPRITHFYIDKDKRSMKTARKMLKLFRRFVMFAGYLFYIIEVPDNKLYLKRIARYLKGIKYDELNGSTYYYAPIFGRIKG
jgi:hypothetical protein